MFLNCIKGKEQIIKLHDIIYSKILPTHLNLNFEYFPHITLGKVENINIFKDFSYEFKTIVDEIYIELIGEHEESIIIDSIKLDNF